MFIDSLQGNLEKRAGELFGIEKVTGLREWLAEKHNVKAEKHKLIAARWKHKGLLGVLGGNLRDRGAVIRDTFTGKVPLHVATTENLVRYKKWLQDRVAADSKRSK